MKFPSLLDDPARLLGRAMDELSNMDGLINAAATENNSRSSAATSARALVIVDRLGFTLELVPRLFGSTRRPTGRRGALLWFRAIMT